MTTEAVVLHEPQQGHVMNAPRGAILRPIAPMKEIVEAKNELDELIVKSLQDGLDYGQVPGAKKTDKKRILYKSGAERVNGWHGVVPRYEIIEREIKHDVVVPYRKKKYNNAHDNDRSYTEVDGESLGLYRYVIRCMLVHRATGEIIGEGLGGCSTLESKYIDRPRDLENTVLKIAKKRSYVDATLTTYALSDRFTQDLEDMKRDDDEIVDTSQTRPVNNKQPQGEQKKNDAYVDERGVPLIPFGSDTIKGKSIDDVAHVPLELLFSTHDWMTKPKNASAQQKFPELFKALVPEMVRRVNENLATDDEFSKMVGWAMKNEERKALYEPFIDALREKMEVERQAALDKQKEEARGEVAEADQPAAAVAD